MLSPEQIKRAYVEGAYTALLDAGYDEKKAAEIAEQMPPPPIGNIARRSPLLPRPTGIPRPRPAKTRVV